MYLFLWREDKELMGNDPFLALVAEDNNVETLKEAVTKKLKLRSGLRMMTQNKNQLMMMRRRRTRTERMKMTRTCSCFILPTIKKYYNWQMFFSNIINVAKGFEWDALAVLGIRERPNLAYNLVTHRH